MTTPDPAAADVKRAAMRAARRRVFIGAHCKFGATSLVQFADWSDFDVVITGRELRDAGPALVRA